MTSYEFLIVGAGMAATAAVKGIRELNGRASIGIIGAEPDPPYARPPLSKGLWKDKALDSIWLDCGDAELILDSTVKELQASRQALLCEDGREIGYGSLLLATGARPRSLPSAEPGVIYLRSLPDYRALRSLCAPGRHFLVLGGGFIGSEIAAALRMNGMIVSMVFPGKGLGSKFLPEDLSLFLNDYYRSKGVELLPCESLHSLEARGQGWLARTLSGKELPVDAVVAGLGAEPDILLAQAAGLRLDDGIAVGPDLRTSDPRIFAAGDVASFFCDALGKRIRSEHEDNALYMGLAAGRNMAGGGELYSRIPSFYGDLFELGYEAAGLLDPSLDIHAEWKKPFERGTVYYLGEGRVRGVLLWNVWRRVEAARSLIAEAGPFSPGELAGRI